MEWRVWQSMVVGEWEREGIPGGTRRLPFRGWGWRVVVEYLCQCHFVNWALYMRALVTGLSVASKGECLGEVIPTSRESDACFA